MCANLRDGEESSLTGQVSIDSRDDNPLVFNQGSPYMSTNFGMEGGDQHNGEQTDEGDAHQSGRNLECSGRDVNAYWIHEGPPVFCRIQYQIGTTNRMPKRHI